MSELAHTKTPCSKNLHVCQVLEPEEHFGSDLFQFILSQEQIVKRVGARKRLVLNV